MSALLGVGLISAAVVISEVPAVSVVVPSPAINFVIALGVVILISAAVGIFGVCKAPQLQGQKQKGNWSLIIFAVASCLIFIALLVGLSFASALANNSNSQVSNDLLASNFKADPVKWLTVQDKLDCCGFLRDPALYTGSLCPTPSPTPYVAPIDYSSLPIPNQTFFVDVPVSFSVKLYFRSPQNHILFFSARQLGSLPFTYVSIQADTGVIAGTPNASALGSTITLVITAKDTQANISDIVKSFTISITTPPPPTSFPTRAPTSSPTPIPIQDCKGPLYVQVQANVSIVLGVLSALLLLQATGVGAVLAMMCRCGCCGPTNTDGGINMDSSHQTEKREFTFSGKPRTEY